MKRGERDRVDPSLIITEPRIPRPTARAQGLDPQERLCMPNTRENATGPKTTAVQSVGNASSEKKREPYSRP